MAKVKEEQVTEKVAENFKQSKTASVDFPVVVESLENDPYHTNGEKFMMGEKKAKQLVAKGWVKIHGEPIKDYKEIIKVSKSLATLVLLLFLSFTSVAQLSVYSSLYNAKNTYSLSNLEAATATQDTVTNTGTGALYAKRITGPGAVTIQLSVAKVSGTVAGTATLHGSLDGVLYDTARLANTVTRVPNHTLQNSSRTYEWNLSASPYLYYKVSTAGGTTTVYYISGKVMKH